MLLTNSASVADVNKYASGQAGRPAPSVIEIDLLDFAATRDVSATDNSRPGRGLSAVHLGVDAHGGRCDCLAPQRDTNVEQIMLDYFGTTTLPEETTVVSWLPFFHDLGLIMGVCSPLVTGRKAVLMSPLAFLLKPASWIQLMAKHPHCFSGAPNFAFELAARRTSDADMEGPRPQPCPRDPQWCRACALGNRQSLRHPLRQIRTQGPGDSAVLWSG